MNTNRLVGVNSLLAMVFMVLILSFFSGLCAQFSGGTGTEEDPYLIGTASDLNNIRNSYLSDHFLQIADIDLSSYENWQPIGNSSTRFTGSYRGNYYKISNLTISASASDYRGLFGYTSNSTLVNIRLENIDITGQYYVAALAGRTNYCTILVSSVVSSMTGVTGKRYVGGLIGYPGFSQISNCYASIGVTGISDATGRTGGLIGYSYLSSIENSYATGEVNGFVQVGGLVGRYYGNANTEILNCYSIGAVSGTSYVGGLIGAVSGGTITNSYWNTQTSGQASSAEGTGRTTAQMTYPYDQYTFVDWDFVFEWLEDDETDNDGYPYQLSNISLFRNPFSGGNGTADSPYQIENAIQLSSIRGYLNSYFEQTDDIVINIPSTPQGWLPIGTDSMPFSGFYDGNNYSISSLQIDRPNTDFVGLFGFVSGNNIPTLSNIVLEVSEITGKGYVGGLAGYIYNANVNDCLIEEESVNSIIEGEEMVGGLIGSSLETIISTCGSNITVTSIAPENSSYWYFGGLIAYANDSEIDNCYAAGSVSGYSYTGGLVGHNLQSISSWGLISGSYASGNVDGNNYIGGLVGSNHRGVLKNCYSLSEVDGVDSVGGLVGINQYDGEIQNSYSIGLVDGATNTGGLVGFADMGSLTEYSYWNTQTSGQASSAGGTGRTTAQMTYPYDQYTYVDWDFNLIWVEDTGNLNNGYPYLSGSTDSPFPGGDGTIHNPYWVETAEHLDMMRNRLNRHFIQTANIDLGVSPWIDNNGWVPVGTNTNNRLFRGSFNGDSYTISNLTIDRQNESNVGLFGVVAGYGYTVLKNITLVDVNITGLANVGSLVGEISNAILDNCVVTGEESEIYAQSYLGGLIGKAESVNVTSSYVSATVETTAISGNSCYGGLIGDSINTNVDSCYFIGNVIGLENVGGLVGNNRKWLSGRGIISSSYSDASVDGITNVGGLVGRNYTASIINSYASGQVTGTYLRTGGLVGLNESQSGEIGTISKSYSVAEVIGVDGVGGLVGNNQGGSISNCYAAGEVTGDDEVGGLVGNNYSGGVIDKSYSIGLVDGTTAVGGLAGVNNGSVTNSYWDTETSGQPSSAGGTGKTTLEMLTKETYSNWQFYCPIMGHLWSIIFNPYIHETYPYFQWQGNPAEHNFFKDSNDNSAHIKVFEDRNWHWDCFPRLERDQYGYQDARDFLDEIDGIGQADTLYTNEDDDLRFLRRDEHGDWISIDWSGEVNSTEGYKLYITEEDIHYLNMTGEIIADTTSITLYPGRENWIAYFAKPTQTIYDAFPVNVLNSLHTIKAQDWLAFNEPKVGWTFTQQQGQPAPALYYGKMYVVSGGFQTPITFQWETGQTRGSDAFFIKPKPEYFSYRDAPDYESFFIENMEDDENILEVAAFVGDICVGATVFLGGYPMEIQAYTMNITDSEQEVSFVIHRGERSEPERIRVVEVKDKESGKFIPQVIRPLQNQYTVLRLGEFEGEYEEPIKPEFALSQNYPNPFNPETTINFSLPDSGKMTLNIYNIKGQLVRKLLSGEMPAGKHSIVWNSKDDNDKLVGSGVYFYRLTSGKKEQIQKMLLIK